MTELVVTVAFDGYASGRVVLKKICRLLKRFARIWANGSGVVIEVCITNILEEEIIE